ILCRHDVRLRMTKLLHLLVLGMALAFHASASAQTGNPSPRITEARQNRPQPPSSQPSPVSTSAPTPGLGGTAKNSDPRPEEPAVAANAAANSELQALIQEAMGKQPALAGNNVNVSVTMEGIELSGNVSSSRDRLTA